MEINTKIKYSADERLRITRKITLAGISVNIFLAIVKFLLGFFGRSSALMADACHSLTDLSSDLIIFFGVKFWAAPPDKNHPYGHQRLETVVTLIIATSLASIGIAIGYEAIEKIIKGEVSQPMPITLVGALLSIVCKEFVFRKMNAIGKKINSPAVIANSWDARSDAMSSIPVAIAIFVALLKPELAFIDSIGAIIVSVFIIYAAFSIAKPALSEVTERAASEDVLAQIEEIVRSVEGTKSVHAVRTRHMGGGIFVDLHVEVDAELNVKEGHEIASAVKRRLLQEGPDLIDVVVHIEPFEHETFQGNVI
ncbi:MAG: hypothetical protein A2020_12645 [Lentisphaerae bacterium GWF2_45_14]|nr:MAG: hypothetical protein A2020_12645 [Lentisphaerae bacterium GWF2_45_14]